MKLENVENYFKNKITDRYYNAKNDCGIEDFSIEEEGLDLKIVCEEMGEKLEITIVRWAKYTPKQIYNIWEQLYNIWVE